MEDWRRYERTHTSILEDVLHGLPLFLHIHCGQYRLHDCRTLLHHGGRNLGVVEEDWGARSRHIYTSLLSDLLPKPRDQLLTRY